MATFRFDPKTLSPIVVLPSNEWQRRDIVQLASAVVLGGLFSATASGCAPATSDRGIRQQIGFRARQAQALLDFVIDAGEEQQSDALDRFQLEQREISFDLASVLNTKVRSEQWLSFVSPLQFALANEMESRRVRVVPTESDVDAIVERPLPNVVSEDGEPILDVLLDIIVDALDLSDDMKTIKEFLNSSRVRAIFFMLASSIRAALKDRRFAEVATNFRRFLELMVDRETLADLEAKLGKEKVARVLARVAARYVPFIGWSLFVASLLVSIYRNRERLARAELRF
jgi:hypothetical protein